MTDDHHPPDYNPFDPWARTRPSLRRICSHGRVQSRCTNIHCVREMNRRVSEAVQEAWNNPKPRNRVPPTAIPDPAKKVRP